MAALYNEIAYYVRSTIVTGSSILLIQSQDCLSTRLSDYAVSACQVDDLQNVVAQRKIFDATIVLYQFGRIKDPEYKDGFLFNLTSVVKNDGYLIFCEKTDPPNPSLQQYAKKFEDRIDGKNYGLRICWATCLQDSIHRHLNWNNHCFLLQKSENLPGHEQRHNQRHAMDTYNFCDFLIKSYESVYGEGHLTNGGKPVRAEMISNLELQPFERMLEVGCGTGGNTMHAAEEYGVNAMGLDVSSNVLTVACNRASANKDSRVTFTMADVTKHDFPCASFDAIYCRDALAYMENEANLMKKFFTWLKPGGRLVFTHVLASNTAVSIEFEDYVQSENFSIGRFIDYETWIKEAGFKSFEAINMTRKLKSILEKEVCQLKAKKDDYVKAFSIEEFNYWIEEWQKELHFIECGQMEYGLFKAIKDV